MFVVYFAGKDSKKVSMPLIHRRFFRYYWRFGVGWIWLQPWLWHERFVICCVTVAHGFSWCRLRQIKSPCFSLLPVQLILRNYFVSFFALYVCCPLKKK